MLGQVKHGHARDQVAPVQTQPFQSRTVLCNQNHGAIGDLRAIGQVQVLQIWATYRQHRHQLVHIPEFESLGSWAMRRNQSEVTKQISVNPSIDNRRNYRFFLNRVVRTIKIFRCVLFARCNAACWRVRLAA